MKSRRGLLLHTELPAAEPDDGLSSALAEANALLAATDLDAADHRWLYADSVEVLVGPVDDGQEDHRGSLVVTVVLGQWGDSNFEGTVVEIVDDAGRVHRSELDAAGQARLPRPSGGYRLSLSPRHQATSPDHAVDWHRSRRAARRRWLWNPLPAFAAAAALILLFASVSNPTRQDSVVPDQVDRVVASVNLFEGDCLQTTLRSTNHVVVAAVWAGKEREKFTQVLERFSNKHNIDVTFATNTTETPDRNIGETLDSFLANGCPPDVALLPQPGLLRKLAGDGDLLPVDEITEQLIKENYTPAWQDAAMVQNTSYGVWFKAGNKSLIWYDVQAFEEAGITATPRTWDELKDAAGKLERVGITPFSVGGADGWTLTDWFENVYLRMYPDLYEALSNHAIPWTHPSVRGALVRLGEIFGHPGWVAEGALDTTYEESVHQVFGPGQRKAAMVFEGEFVATEIAASGGVVGVDAKSFDFPEIGNESAPLVGSSSLTSGGTAVGGDVAVLMRDTPAANLLLQFLATPEAAEPWEGGFTSPNRKVRVKSDDASAPPTRAVAEATQVNFDLSDLQCPAFGVGSMSSMSLLLQSFLDDPASVADTSQRLEDAWLPPPGIHSADGRAPCPKR